MLRAPRSRVVCFGVGIHGDRHILDALAAFLCAVTSITLSAAVAGFPLWLRCPVRLHRQPKLAGSRQQCSASALASRTERVNRREAARGIVTAHAYCPMHSWGSCCVFGSKFLLGLKSSFDNPARLGPSAIGLICGQTIGTSFADQTARAKATALHGKKCCAAICFSDGACGVQRMRSVSISY